MFRAEREDAMGKIAILSHLVIDEIRRAGGDATERQVGGAGAYAATGASLASGPGVVVAVSGVGRADRALMTAWCERRQIDPAGLFEADQHGPVTRIDYSEDGDRLETPVFGIEHFDAHTPLARHIPVPIEALDGAYLFHDHGAEYWEAVEPLRRSLSGPMMWEISRDSCIPEALAIVRERAAGVEVLSINRAEVLALTGAATTAEAIAAIAPFAPLVLLRLGESGSLVLEGGHGWRVPALPVAVVDPTGGGNSYSGAFLAAYASTGDPRGAARVATAAATLVVAQHGAPEVDALARERVLASALELIVTDR